MPGAACNALNSIQLVTGCDIHKQIPPPPPAGPLPAPHPVAYCMGFAFPSTSKKSKKVQAGWGFALARQHDLGMGPYHFAANALLPLIWLGASNKAEFGSSTVNNDQGHMAVALIPMVGINLQLDCCDPCALPFGMCFASFNTVKCGFTAGDCIGGFAAMVVDIGWSFVVSKVAGKLTKLAGAVLASSLGAVADGVPLFVVGLASAAFPSASKFVADATTMVFGWIIGTPLGYSFPTPWGSLGGKLNDKVNDYFADPPGA